MTPEDAAWAVAVKQGLPRPKLVRIGMNHTYRAGSVALRVSSPDEQVSLMSITSALTAAQISHAEPLGSPMHIDDLEVTSWRWVDAAATGVDFETFGAAVRRLHDLDREVFSALEPIRWCADFAHLDLASTFMTVASEFDDVAREALEAELHGLADWRHDAAIGEVVVCHGDVHFNNVIAPATIIDWDMLCVAPRAWDHAALISATRRWGLPRAAYDAFSTGYGLDFRGDEVAERLVRLRDLAATILTATRASIVPEAAQELRNRLRYWRGDREAPPWNAL